MTAAERAEMEAWVDADPLHKEAFDSFNEIAEGAMEDDAVAIAAMEEDLERFSANENLRTNQFRLAAGIAASIALVVTATVLMRPQVEIYETARGEMREVVLADGTSITLNTDSAISVRYARNRRNVSLDRGEALFVVAHAPERPFVVSSDAMQVQVLGTSFNVYAKGGETVVSVLSGVVEVKSDEQIDGDGASEQLTLTTGQQVAVSSGGAMTDIESFDTNTIISWRLGRAYYENEPLSDVIADLNRYFPREISIGDTSLSSVPVTGSFDLGDQYVAVEAIKVALSLRAETNASGNIVLFPEEQDR
jgi:transmembrane sensor